jgi:hypothetical protein
VIAGLGDGQCQVSTLAEQPEGQAGRAGRLGPGFRPGAPAPAQQPEGDGPGQRGGEQHQHRTLGAVQRPTGVRTRDITEEQVELEEHAAADGEGRQRLAQRQA